MDRLSEYQDSRQDSSSLLSRGLGNWARVVRFNPQGNLKGTSLPGSFHCSDVIFSRSFGSPLALSVPAFLGLSGHGSCVSVSALFRHLSSPLGHFLHGPGWFICWFPPALPESPQSKGILSHLVLSGCPSASELLLRLPFLISARHLYIFIHPSLATPPEGGNAFIPYLYSQLADQWQVGGRHSLRIHK